MDALSDTDRSSSRLADRTAIVTGAGRNIGRAIAEALAADGADVMLVGRNAEPLEDVAANIKAAGGRCFSFAADVTCDDDVNAIAAAASQRWGRIDILVNNAGTFDEPRFFDLDEVSVRRVLDTNVVGLLLLSQAVAARMAATGGGSIVHISSVDARGADGGLSVYPASKAAVSSFARTMSVELAPLGIRVNAVSPGWISTDFTEKAFAPNVVRHLRSSFSRVPIGRLVTPQEVAAAVVFLASDASAAITGADLLVDGGLTANLFVEETLPGATVDEREV